MMPAPSKFCRMLNIGCKRADRPWALKGRHGVIIMCVLREQREQQAMDRWTVRRSSLWISLWLVACLSVGNPLACLLHCWYHTSTVASPASEAVQPVATQPHHGAAHGNDHGQTRSTDQAPTTTDSSLLSSCLRSHQMLSAVTMAVLLSLLWVVIPFNPGIPLRLPRLSLRLVIFPPPHRPPRFAPFLSS